jgi:hypothetical protein
MNTQTMDVIRRAIDYGVQVALHGDRLRMTAPRKLPDDLLAELRRHKAEIIAFLSHRPAEGVTSAEVIEAGRPCDVFELPEAELGNVLEPGHEARNSQVVFGGKDALCSVFSQVADAFKLIGNLDRTHDVTKIERHGLTACNHQNCVLVNFALKPVQSLVRRNNPVRLRTISL